MAPMVEAASVHKSFGSTEVLCGVDMVVQPGEVACVIGPSGSGKSTFLRCVNHLERIDSGTMRVDGDLIGYREANGKLYELGESEIARQRRHIGMVFQRFHLFPHMTAAQNVMEGPRTVQRLAKGKCREQATALLERVGLGDKQDAYPNQLSGGQQQRVGIARALALRPKLMLFDEPTSALDPELVGEVLQVIKDLAQEGWTMVVVTHEIRFAQQVADQVLFIDGGVVLESGPPSQVLTEPEQPRTRQFLQRILDPI